MAAANESKASAQGPRLSIGAVAKAADRKPGQLMFPLRVALSGKAGGPDLGACGFALGVVSAAVTAPAVLTGERIAGLCASGSATSHQPTATVSSSMTIAAADQMR